MGLFNFNKKPKTRDVSKLNFKLFEKFGWNLYDHVNDLKNFPVEEYYIETGLKNGSGGLMRRPALFQGSFSGKDYSIWYELFCDKMRWNVQDDNGNCIYVSEDLVLEEKHFIEIENDINHFINLQEHYQKQRDELEEIKKKPIAELTADELLRLGLFKK